MSKKIKILIIIFLALFVVFIAVSIIFNEGSKRNHIEEDLEFKLPNGIQVINYKRDYGFIAAKILIPNEYLDEITDKLETAEFHDTEELNKLGYNIDDDYYTYASTILDDMVNWWDFKGNQISQYYYRNGNGKQYKVLFITLTTSLSSETRVYIVKNDNDTFYIYFYRYS